MDTIQIIQDLIKIARTEWIITIATFFATIATIVGGIVTTVWFIRDTRKENSKILKSILDVQMRIEEGQRKGFAALEEGQRKGFAALEEGLRKLEEGQRKGFAALEEAQRKGFAALEKGQRKGFTALEEGQRAIAEMVSNQTKILEKILGRLP